MSENDVYRIALEIYGAIHDTASPRDACRVLYRHLDGIVPLDRLFCIVAVEPLEIGSQVIDFAVYFDGGEEQSLSPRRLDGNELITQALAWGALLSSEDKGSEVRQISPELLGMNCWILIPLTSSVKRVVGVLGVCRNEPRIFSESEKVVLTAVAGAIAQVAIKWETIRCVKARERELVIGEVAASLLHEIINVLGTIPIHVQVIEEHLRSSQIRYPEEIDRHLDDIDKDLREIESKTEERMREIKKALSAPAVEMISVMELIEEILQAVDTNQYSLSAELQPDTPRIRGHRRYIAEAFKNIIQNGLQAMSDSDTRELNVVVEPWSDAMKALWVRVEITDTGHGIRQEDLERIYEPFYSTKSPTRGFGLYWAKIVIEESNGMIDVQSQVNKGTTFAVKLPALPAE
jgi:signal transduction histidine kinase